MFHESFDWGSDTDSQVMSAVHDLKQSLETLNSTAVAMDPEWGDVTDTELLHDVTIIESSLELLLMNAPPRELPRISKYQGPSIPMPTPTFCNDSVVIAQKRNQTKTQCKPTFDLGFFNQDKDDGCARVPEKTSDAVYILNKKKCQYHPPRQDDEMD